MTSWQKLRDEAAQCTRCDLYRRATQTVFGEGRTGVSITLRGPARVRVARGRPGRRAPGPVQRRPAARAGKQGVRCLGRALLRDMGARGKTAQHVLQNRMLGRPGPPGQAGGTRSGGGPRRGPLDGRTGRHPRLGGPALLVRSQAQLCRLRWIGRARRVTAAAGAHRFRRWQGPPVHPDDRGHPRRARRRPAPSPRGSPAAARGRNWYACGW